MLKCSIARSASVATPSSLCFVVYDRLAKAMGREDLGLSNPRFATDSKRHENEEEINAVRALLGIASLICRLNKGRCRVLFTLMPLYYTNMYVGDCNMGW